MSQLLILVFISVLGYCFVFVIGYFFLILCMSGNFLLDVLLDIYILLQIYLSCILEQVELLGNSMIMLGLAFKICWVGSQQSLFHG